MERIQKSKISGFALALAFLGMASMVLSFFGYEVIVLLWIDLWGETIAWVFRISMIVVGLAIYFLMEVDDEVLFHQEKEAE